jgi:preprotein translocase subunit SecY
MKKLIETLRNINKIDELRKRILYTLGIILIYRLGSHIVLPGVDPNMLANLQSQASGGLLGLLNMFSGGAFANASIFALGIMPYISASIVIQLLGMAIPYFQRLQREGESGRRKSIRSPGTLPLPLWQCRDPAILPTSSISCHPKVLHLSTRILPAPQHSSGFRQPLFLIAGTLFVMWLGERITDKGIGNGISLIIMIGIIAQLPFALIAEFFSRLEQKRRRPGLFPCRNCGAGVCYITDHFAGSGNPKGACAVCQTYCG